MKEIKLNRDIFSPRLSAEGVNKKLEYNTISRLKMSHLWKISVDLKKHNPACILEVKTTSVLTEEICVTFICKT